jgi:hypothetical protein
MNYVVRLTLVWVMTLVFLASFAFAEVPQIINYQGRLTDGSGNPVADGPYLIKFKIYGSESGDDSLWYCGFQPVDVENGLFEYQLGSAAPLPDDLFSADTVRWLGITVGTDAEVSPRSRLTSIAYAYQALRADSAGYAFDLADGSVTTSKLADNAVTSAKIADDAVTSTEIQDYSIITSDIAYDAVTSDKIQDATIMFEDINQNGAALDQVMKWDGSQWTASDDEEGAGGDITAVNAGSGLTGGGTSGDVTVAVAADGITSGHIGSSAVGTSEIADNAVVSSKILDGTIQFSDMGQNGATLNEIMKWDGNLWVPASDENSGGDITAVSAGSGLAGGGVSGAVSLSVAADGINAGHIAADAVGSSEIATGAVGNLELASNSVSSTKITNGTITDADINPSADISISKIIGTAVNLTAGQTITGGKTFNNYVRFGDSTMMVNPTGIRIGDVTNPSESYLMRAERNYNTTMTRWGFYTNLENPSTGDLFGVYSSVRSSTAGSGGDVYAVRGSATSDGSGRYGLYGYAQARNVSITTGLSYGVYAIGYDGAASYGIYAYGGSATTNWAGYFSGNINVTGSVVKAADQVKIDHPLDPENKYLVHSSVESPDMKNVYDGVVTLDGNGEAIVDLPDYFDALNGDFRYQLTPLGAPGPNLYISERISGNNFTIAGGVPYMEVSWQVTGIRKDPFAEANRIEVEAEKPDDEKGLYLHPEAYGFGRERFINYEQERAAELEMEESRGE